MADRKISDLTALTTPASGDYLPIVDISESAAASKNKRITIEELLRGAPDGTAAAPSIAFESDPNTGIYSPGADQVAISTNGTGRLFVDANGRLGVGTSSPGTLVHGSASGAGARFRAQSTDASGVIVEMLSDGSSAGVLSTNSNHPLVFQTNATESLRIDSSARLLIGTSSGAGSSPLQAVTGTAGRFQSFAFTKGSLGQSPSNANIFKVRMSKLSDGLSATLALNVLVNGHATTDAGAQASATYNITLLRVGGWGGTANTQIQANVSQIGSTVTQGLGGYTITGLSVSVDVGASSNATEDATIRVSYTASAGGLAAFCYMSGTCASSFSHALELFAA